MPLPQSESPPVRLTGQRVALVGKLSSMSKRDAQQLLRQHGATVLERPDGSATLIVVGDEAVSLQATSAGEPWLDEAIRAAADAGRLEIINEPVLWQRLGMCEEDDTPGVQRLYTTAMLASLLNVSTAVIRRWQRRGLITPVREVRRLAYFDFQEVANARSIAQLLAQGMRPETLQRKLAELARFLPDAQRRLAQLSVIVEGKRLLLRQGDGLLDQGGQLHFDFDAEEARHEQPDAIVTASLPLVAPAPADEQAVVTEWEATPQELVRAAAKYEDEDECDLAAASYRMALVVGGPSAEINFRLAELLYRAGDLGAARERYYMAIELDEDFVEARANLGCLLAELGCVDLAVAAFEGALAYHADYADAHYHLAKALDDLQDGEQAEHHWRTFLTLAPDSPWASEAKARLSMDAAD